jgi:hypothetical protein
MDRTPASAHYPLLDECAQRQEGIPLMVKATRMNIGDRDFARHLIHFDPENASASSRGLVIQELSSAAPSWSAARSASDPQMDTTGLTVKEVRQKAWQIYERFGDETTISSPLACWALILDN